MRNELSEMLHMNRQHLATSLEEYVHSCQGQLEGGIHVAYKASQRNITFGSIIYKSIVETEIPGV